MRESIRQRGLAVLLALALLLSGVLVVLAQDGGESTPVLGGDEASLRALLSRLAESYGPDGGHSEIEVGAVTARLPFSLPLPDDTEVLGSISDLNGTDTYHVQVIATSALEPADIVAFYEDALTAEPWHDMRELTGDAPGGFTVQQSDWANFCYGDSALFQVSARALTDATTDIRYHVQLSPLPDLCTGNYPSTNAGQAFGLLPALFPPDGATQLGSSGGSGGTNGLPAVYSAADLETDLSLDALHTAYADQLAAAGWEALSQEVGTHLAWSGWRFTDDDSRPWEATLTIVGKAVASNQVTIQLNLSQVAR